MPSPLADLPVYNQGGTTYTVADSDCGAMIDHSNASATTITLPADKPRGFIVSFTQSGAGQITFSAGSGATVHTRGSKNKTAGQYAAASAVVKSNAGGAAVWLLTGDLTS